MISLSLIARRPALRDKIESAQDLTFLCLLTTFPSGDVLGLENSASNESTGSRLRVRGSNDSHVPKFSGNWSCSPSCGDGLKIGDTGSWG